MTAWLTNIEVFDFMGTPTDVRTTQGSAVTDLIARCVAEFEQFTGRKVESESITDAVFYNGYNCEIYGNKMYLRGKYRDLYKITSFKEYDATLSEAVNLGDNGYKLLPGLGIIQRIGQNMLLTEMAYKITGKLGMCSSSDDTVLKDVKQLIIEMVACKSGIWKNNVQTNDGTIVTIRTVLSEDAKKRFDGYRLREV